VKSEGLNGVEAVTEGEIVGLGSIAQAVRAFNFDQIPLLNNFTEAEADSGWMGNDDLTVRFLHSILTIVTHIKGVPYGANSSEIKLYD
jgi:hypothetical protein